MARVSTYLNFMGTTEQAFAFYKEVFGTEYDGEIHRIGNAPPSPDMPPLSEKEKNYIMHVALPILGGHVLMGTDALESMGPLTVGNNFSINLEPDTRAEADRLFAALSAGGKVSMPMTDMFWGAYWGSFVDKFGVQWMINCPETKK
ncbi:MAG: VOC family protein [Polyangiales bacterium]